MPKMKSKSGAKKRFKLTKSGKVKHGSAYLGHILNKKATKRKRHLRAPAYVGATNVKEVKGMLPYA